MRLRMVVYLLCTLLVIILQTTLLNYIEIFGIKANLILVFTICTALLRGGTAGAAAGFFTGLFQDILTGKALGVYALLGMYLGLLAGSINKRLYKENLIVIFFFTFSASVVYEFAIFGFGVLGPALLGTSSDSTGIIYALGRVILPEAAYNSVLAVFIYLFLTKLLKVPEPTDRPQRKY
jgi:rod shape-determining protein MreD